MEPAFAATSCDSGPSWTTSTTDVEYRNDTAHIGKLTRVKASIGSNRHVFVSVKGRATTVLAPPVGSTLGLPIVVQLLADDTCFGATFPSAPANRPDKLRAGRGQ